MITVCNSDMTDLDLVPAKFLKVLMKEYCVLDTMVTIFVISLCGLDCHVI